MAIDLLFHCVGIGEYRSRDCAEHGAGYHCSDFVAIANYGSHFLRDLADRVHRRIQWKAHQAIYRRRTGRKTDE
jgi:hypothetical protein